MSIAGLERLLPMYATPSKPGAFALLGSVFLATVVNAAVLAIYTAAIVLTARAVG
jgi:hypothetical protein